MEIVLEDFVPYDKSLQWQIQDAYFAVRGIAAWTAGDIPYYSTSNYPIARQHARFLIDLVKDLEKAKKLSPKDDVVVLEIGSGLGLFVASFFKALEEGTGKEGRALAARLRYIFSDYSEVSVREAMRSPNIKGIARHAQITPALFDFRKPTEIRPLDGQKVPGPILALLANYVCCVSGMKHIRKQKGQFLEKYVRVKAEVKDEDLAGKPPPSGAEMVAEILARSNRPTLQSELKIDVEWRPADLDKLFADPAHPRALRETVAAFDDATVGYPYVFLEMIRGMQPLLRPEGVYLVADYGTANRADLRGTSERKPQHYGNTVSQGVDFPIFDAFFEREGRGVIRTENGFRSLHMACVRNTTGVPAEVKRAFKDAYIDAEDGEDLLDFSAAAKQWVKAEEPSRAVRLYQRCLRIDPENVECLFRIGEACLDAGYLDAAAGYLEQGRKHDRDRTFDFDFALGRTYYRLKRYEEAEVAYKRSLEREDDVVTHANLGVIYEEMKDWKRAYAAYKHALTKNPEYERGKTLLRGFEEVYAREMLSAPEAPRPALPLGK